MLKPTVLHRTNTNTTLMDSPMLILVDAMLVDAVLVDAVLVTWV